MEADEIVYRARSRLAKLFNVRDAARIVFTANATEALNLAIKGLLEPGDHVVTSGMEHNAVWRCLKTLERDQAFTSGKGLIPAPLRKAVPARVARDHRSSDEPGQSQGEAVGEGHW